jgi:predicted signal transduction protein with EAL and GGDEF domain
VEHHYVAITVNWIINIAFGIIALVAALCAIRLCDKLMFKKIDFIEEIAKGNTAAALGFAAMLAFAAYIIGSSVR